MGIIFLIPIASDPCEYAAQDITDTLNGSHVWRTNFCGKVKTVMILVLSPLREVKLWWKCTATTDVLVGGKELYFC